MDTQAIKELLEQLHRGELEQPEARKKVGEAIHAIMDEIRVKNELLQDLQSKQMLLNTMGNYVEKNRAAYQAKLQEAGEVKA